MANHQHCMRKLLKMASYNEPIQQLNMLKMTIHILLRSYHKTIIYSQHRPVHCKIEWIYAITKVLIRVYRLYMHDTLLLQMCILIRYIATIGSTTSYSSPINALSKVLFPQLCCPNTLIQISLSSTTSLVFCIACITLSGTMFPFFECSFLKALVIFYKGRYRA